MPSIGKALVKTIIYSYRSMEHCQTHSLQLKYSKNDDSSFSAISNNNYNYNKRYIFPNSSDGC